MNYVIFGPHSLLQEVRKPRCAKCNKRISPFKFEKNTSVLDLQVSCIFKSGKHIGGSDILFLLRHVVIISTPCVVFPSKCGNTVHALCVSPVPVQRCSACTGKVSIAFAFCFRPCHRRPKWCIKFSTMTRLFNSANFNFLYSGNSWKKNFNFGFFSCRPNILGVAPIQLLSSSILFSENSTAASRSSSSSRSISANLAASRSWTGHFWQALRLSYKILIAPT